MRTITNRERAREELRTRIVEAARDILSEKGLDALSMRAIARRVEYSAAALYLYFQDKDELIREVVRSGFDRLHEYTVAALEEEVENGRLAPVERYAATGRAYARFALENTAYFRVIFELPGVARFEHPGTPVGRPLEPDEDGLGLCVALVQEGIDRGLLALDSAESGALIGWGLIHGLVSLYVSGHLGGKVQTHEEFLALVEEAMRSLYEGWKVPDGAGADAADPPEPGAGERVEQAGPLREPVDGRAVGHGADGRP
jgi:AcrR family transcriptional regulator